MKTARINPVPVTKVCTKKAIALLVPHARKHGLSILVMGTALLETYLRQPYTLFLGRYSGDMSKTMLSEVA
jgi:hypothetical protein